MTTTTTETFKPLVGFISRSQVRVVGEGMAGEEHEYFFTKMAELAETIRTMPKTYEQDGKGDQAIAYLHYFKNGCDWYITERDQEAEQHQAFGLADLGHGGELGYISLVELIQANVELDFHFKPTTLAELKKKHQE